MDLLRDRPGRERIARNPRYFTFLRDCAPHARVVLGDARLSLADAPDHHYDLIVLDAFARCDPGAPDDPRSAALYLSKLRSRSCNRLPSATATCTWSRVLAALARDAGVLGMKEDRAPLSSGSGLR